MDVKKALIIVSVIAFVALVLYVARAKPRAVPPDLPVREPKGDRTP